MALLSCGLLSLAEAVALLDALFASAAVHARPAAASCSTPTAHCPASWSATGSTPRRWPCRWCRRCWTQGRTDLLQRQSDGTVRFAPALANRGDLEAAGADLGDALQPLAEAYERVLNHHAFTGRSGTMFGYEGLGCIYWHMVAKLLLAVQEQRVRARPTGRRRELPALIAYYRRVRDGLGYRKDAAAYGAFPADPYSHTPGEGGAQQPGMTGQVKEEILTRWGELGLRVRDGRVHFDPVLLDAAELPEARRAGLHLGVACPSRTAGARPRGCRVEDGGRLARLPRPVASTRGACGRCGRKSPWPDARPPRRRAISA